MQKITMSKKTNLTVDDAFELFIRKCKIKNLTDLSVESYESKIKRLYEFYGKDSLVSEIDFETIDKFVLWLRENTEANDVTINGYLRAARAFLYFCMDNGYVARFDIKLIKAETKLKETYTNDELMSLLKRPDMNTCSFSTYKTWVFINFLVGTGARISTALDVCIEDINFESGVIVYKKNKNRKQQIIPLSATLSDILGEYLQIRGGEPKDYLFCNEYGEHAIPRTYQQLVRRYNRKRGVYKTSCHAFRHTFAKNWVMAGGDPFRLQKILGHSTLSMTMQYVNMFLQDLQMDFEKFNVLDNLKTRKNVIHM